MAAFLKLHLNIYQIALMFNFPRSRLVLILACTYSCWLSSFCFSKWKETFGSFKICSMFLSLICALMEVLILGSQGGMSTKGVHSQIIEAGSSRVRWRMSHKTLKDDFSLSWWENLFRWCMPTASHRDNKYLTLFAISTSLQKRTLQTPHGRVKTIHLHNFKFFYISVIMMITHCCFCYQPQHACWFCFLLPADQPRHACQFCFLLPTD